MNNETAKKICASRIMKKFKEIYFVMDRLAGDRYISFWENVYGETIRAFSDNISSDTPYVHLELLVKKPFAFEK